MAQEQFTITPQDYYNTKGQKIDSFEVVLIRLVGYRFFDTDIQAYVEKQNANGQRLGDGFVVNIPTPQNWGADDMAAIEAIAASPAVDCIITGNYTPNLINP